jgi:hypothetical protein
MARSMTQENLKPVDPATAEVEALAIQEAEDRAEHRFDQVHASLEAAGRVQEATDSPEFHDWMSARARTDAAWGRWAMAMDAAR